MFEPQEEPWGLQEVGQEVPLQIPSHKTGSQMLGEVISVIPESEEQTEADAVPVGSHTSKNGFKELYLFRFTIPLVRRKIGYMSIL